jgi:hypothetical protein
LKRIVSRLVLALLVLWVGYGHAPRLAAGQKEITRTSQYQSQARQAAINCGGTQKLEDIEERQGPFTVAGQRFNAVLHYKCFPGKSGLDSRTLVSLEIRDATGEIQYRKSFPYAVEEGAFTDICSAGVRPLRGSSGKGFLIEWGCLPSAPLAGGPWQIVGVVGGKLVPIGKPLVTEGEWDEFVPGAITRIGNLTQILPDMIKIRVWTGYFFVSVPVRIDWHGGKLAPGQRCMYQTGHGFAEEGCEMPVYEARITPREQEMTFVRMFRESNERCGPAAHIVVKKDSTVEVVAGKVLIIWKEGREAIYLSVGEDVWVKIRIDGKEGWIHTPEDLNAIGLFASG